MKGFFLNAFLNAHQMSTQQVVHIPLSIPLYHSIRTFQFVNTCEQQDTTYYYHKTHYNNYPQTLQKSIANHWLINTSIDMKC